MMPISSMKNRPATRSEFDCRHTTLALCRARSDAPHKTCRIVERIGPKVMSFTISGTSDLNGNSSTVTLQIDHAGAGRLVCMVRAVAAVADIDLRRRQPRHQRRA